MDELSGWVRTQWDYLGKAGFYVSHLHAQHKRAIGLAPIKVKSRLKHLQAPLTPVIVSVFPFEIIILYTSDPTLCRKTKEKQYIHHTCTVANP